MRFVSQNALTNPRHTREPFTGPIPRAKVGIYSEPLRAILRSDSSTSAAEGRRVVSRWPGGGPHDCCGGGPHDCCCCWGGGPQDCWGGGPHDCWDGPHVGANLAAWPPTDPWECTL